MKNESKNQSDGKTGRGRPPIIYDQEVADEISERIAKGESLLSICSNDHIPSYTTIMKWLRENAYFSQNYARSRIDQADTIYYEIVDVEQRLESGEIDPATARVLGDLKRWRAARMKPKVYGDSKHLEITVDDELRNMPQAQLEALYQAKRAEMKAEMRAEIIAEYEAAKQLPDPDVIDGEVLPDTSDNTSDESEDSR